MAKNIRVFLENLFEYYFLNIIVNVKLFSDLKLDYYCEYYPEILQVSLKYKTKIAGRSHEIFSKQIQDHEKFRFMASWATKCFLKNLQNPPVFLLLHT